MMRELSRPAGPGRYRSDRYRRQCQRDLDHYLRSVERKRARLHRAAAAHGATAQDVADRQIEPSPRDLVDPFWNAGETPALPGGC